MPFAVRRIPAFLQPLNGACAFMETQYELDHDNRIVDVDETWSAFAAENGTDALERNKVLGRDIASYIAGWSLADMYTTVFDYVRDNQVVVVAPFRCDSPESRRYMELEIAPRPERHLQLTGRLVRQQDHPYVPLLDLKQKRNGQWQVVCSVCRRIKIAGEQWLEVEDALDDPYAIPDEGLPLLTHDVCPDCVAMMRGLVSR